MLLVGLVAAAVTVAAVVLAYRGTIPSNHFGSSYAPGRSMCIHQLLLWRSWGRGAAQHNKQLH
mgnify:CR=1 FL=1